VPDRYAAVGHPADTVPVSLLTRCSGGAGGAITRACADARITATVRTLSLPAEFLGHGDRAALLAQAGLDAHGITRAVLDQTAPRTAARVVAELREAV
jgi:deoxyxylulose-5-phosphate synthase